MISLILGDSLRKRGDSMHQKIKSKSRALRLVGAFIALFPLVAYPLGLGKLKVHSALNEPLNAEIEFTSATESELKGLKAVLASRADFETAGAERLPYLSQIKFAVVKRSSGKHVLEMKTEQVVEEPFLHLLLQVEWTGGRLVREYSALIDPPYYVAGKPSGIEAPKLAPVAPAPALEPTLEPAPVAAVETPAVTPVAPDVAAAQTPPEASPTTDVANQELYPGPDIGSELLGPEESLEIAMTDSGWPEDGSPKIERLDARTRDANADVAKGSQPAKAKAADASQYVVKRGDTVWQVAEKLRVDNQLTVEQVIVAIFRNNKDAFFESNVNNLKVGKVLKLPEGDIAAAISAAQARKEFRAQYNVWQEYKLKLAASRRPIKVAENSSEPAVEPTAEATPAPTPTPAPVKGVATPEDKAKQPEDLLKIVRGTLDTAKTPSDQSVAKGSAAGAGPKERDKHERSALADRVTTLEESLESKQLENREMTEKLGQVKSQVDNQSRLIELENLRLAEAQKQAGSPQISTPPPAPTPVAADPAPSAPEATTPVREVPPRKPASVSQKSLVDTVTTDWLSGSVLPMVGGIVALGGGIILLMYLRRRHKSMAEFEESILASDVISTENSITSDAGQAVTTGDTSFLSDFSQSGPGQTHADDVDPVAEAEVYLAYGRDETAEEILKEAVIKHPERHELKLKLLEIYHQRSDVGAFETIAEELYAAHGGRGSKVWDKVEEMGRRLSPDNPMFRGGAPGRRVSDHAVAAAIGGAGAGTSFREDTVLAPSTNSSGTSGDFADPLADLDFDSPEPAHAEPTKMSDFTLDLDEPAMPEAASKMNGGGAHRGREATDNLIDFSASNKKKESAFGANGVDDTMAGIDNLEWRPDEKLPMAASAASGTSSAHWDETATKLDLAKAYMDMGDSEGARSILNEVLTEGNDNQKKQAADLVAQIG